MTTKTQSCSPLLGGQSYPQIQVLCLLAVVSFFLASASAVEVGKRPRIFFALTGTSGLANPANDSKWTYVQDNIDGIWYNTAGQSEDLDHLIIKKIKTRKVIGISSSLDPLTPGAAGNPAAHIQVHKPDINLFIETYAFYINDVSKWRTGATDKMRAFWVDNDSPWRATLVMSGFSSSAFTVLLSGNPRVVEISKYPAAIEAVQGADQIFVETSKIDNAKRAIKMAHDNGKPFLLFVSSGYGFEYLRNQYNQLVPYLTEDDIVLIVNYHENTPVTPESSTGSYTGILKWLLQQGTNKYQGKQAPTNLTLTTTLPSSGLITGAPVGSFTTTDPDPDDTNFSASFTAGGADNDLFIIADNQLKIGQNFAGTTKNNFSIRVRSYDQWAFWVEKTIIFSLPTTPSDPVPTVSISANSSSNPVTTASTTLSVLGQDDRPASELIYTWSTTGTPPAPVTFTPSAHNGTNAGQSISANFTQAGLYTLEATIEDAAGGKVSSSVTVMVNSTLTSAIVSPPMMTILAGGTRSFTATGIDQFGVPLLLKPTWTWTVASGGTISTAGVFKAGSTNGGPYVVTAQSGTVTTTAQVQITTSAIDASPPAGPPAPTVVNGNTTRPTLSGSTEPGATITISGATSPGITVATDPVTGAWTYTFPTPLPDGFYAITVTATDGANNVSAPSPAVIIGTPATTPSGATSTGTGGGGGACGLGSGGVGLCLLGAWAWLAFRRRGTHAAPAA